jgi:aspartyl-tRNA(Asn)/glutamyl-tRNA(Gln) amidotransferase subunit A
MEFAPFQSTVTGIAAAVQSGKASPREIASFYVERTQKHQATLNSHISFELEAIESEIRRVEDLISAGWGEKLRLAGVPILIKDSICTKDYKTTCGSNILKNYTPPYDATVVERLRAAGALIFGKTNMDEFAMGSSSESSAFGATKNPWDLLRVPGGSSGGSAAAVAADLAPAALGSDTGGSIRQPASFCGISGFKPTYGAVSRFGLVAYGSSLDHIGPMTRNIRDAALIFDVIAGSDSRDATSRSVAGYGTFSKLKDLDPKRFLRDCRIGYLEELTGDGVDPDVRNEFKNCVRDLENMGAKTRPVKIDLLKTSIAIYYVIATAEASSNLARYDGVRYGLRQEAQGDSLGNMYRTTRATGFGREVKRRVLLGTFVLSSGYYDAYYGKACAARAEFTRTINEVFRDFDLLISPTAPTPAFMLGEKVSDPLAMYLSDIGTIFANLAGLPAVSLPCGKSKKGLPIGVQFTGPHGSDEDVLRGAYCYELVRSNWSGNDRPKL